MAPILGLGKDVDASFFKVVACRRSGCTSMTLAGAERYTNYRSSTFLVLNSPVNVGYEKTQQLLCKFMIIINAKCCFRVSSEGSRDFQRLVTT